MKRIPYVALLTALSMFVGAAAYAQTDSTKAAEGSKAEEKKETPAQERAEEKTEAKAEHHKAPKAPKMVFDVNTAAKEDLTKVPGITDELADKIIAGRPYKSRGELMSKSILTKAEYAKVRSHLMVKKVKASAAAAK